MRGSDVEAVNQTVIPADCRYAAGHHSPKHLQTMEAEDASRAAPHGPTETESPRRQYRAVVTSKWSLDVTRTL
jgi:hypothetical protein